MNLQNKENKRHFYNALFPYCYEQPCFVNTSIIKQKEILEKNWEVFLNEFLAYHQSGLSSKDSMRTGRGYYEPGLKTITLLTNMYRYHKRCRYFPKTMEILESIPELSLLTINVLHPNTYIKSHYGETDATYRCHIGLIIPAGLPECGIRVCHEEREWEEGKMLAFIDGNRHKVWNGSKGDRVVLIADFIRPDAKESKWVICGKIWASLILSGLIVKWPIIKCTPLFWGEKILAGIGFTIICGIKIQRFFNFEVPLISRN